MSTSTIKIRYSSASLIMRSLWGLCALLAVGIAFVSLRYFFIFPRLASQGEFGAHFARYFPLLLPHIIGGVIALALGPWQFAESFRNRYLNLHRWLGRIYLLAVLLGSIAGLGMATVSLGGLATHTGFGMLAGLWLLTAWLAYRRIRCGEIDAHREWMTRNYALTFAAVTLRLWLPLLVGAFRVEFMDAYRTVSWLCWVPNILVAEWLIHRHKLHLLAHA